MKQTPLKLCLALIVLAGTQASTHAQATKPSRGAAEAANKLEWPKPSSKQSSRAKHLVRRLFAAVEAEEETTELEGEIRELGPAIGRFLLRRLGNSDIDEDGHPALERTLDGVLADEHAPLLVPYLDKKHLQVRRYAASRIARSHDASLAPHLKGVLEREDEDELVRFRVALGLAGLGDFDAFDLVFETCQAAKWRAIAPLVHEVLAPARSADARRAVFTRMQKAKDTQTLVTSLRLMRSLCPKEHAATIAPWLDSQESIVKRETINALRAIVDDDPPLENLSAFQAIDLVKKWKERL